MADISSEIAAFKNAAYGEDVRDAMVSLANKVNDEITINTDNVNQYETRIKNLEYVDGSSKNDYYIDSYLACHESTTIRFSGSTGWISGGLNVNTGKNYNVNNRLRNGTIPGQDSASFHLGVSGFSGIKIQIPVDFKLRIFEYSSTSQNDFVKSYSFWYPNETQYFFINPNYYYRFVIGASDDRALAVDDPDAFLEVTYAYAIDTAFTMENTPADSYSIGTIFNKVTEDSKNIFKLSNEESRTTSGVTITCIDSNTILFDGVASAAISYELFDGDFVNPNLKSNTPYTFNRQLLSGQLVSGNNPYFQYKDASHSSRTTWNMPETSKVFDDNANLLLHISKGSNFDQCLYSFSVMEGDTALHIPSGKTAVDYYCRFFIPELKKPRASSSWETFKIPIIRNYSFGEHAGEYYEYELDCAIALPSSYNSVGTPTRMILACHGSGGYIDANTNYWWSSTEGAWPAYVTGMTDAGYGVFDCNLYPWDLDDFVTTTTVGEANGSPIYIHNCHDLYKYIVEKYNVYPEIFVHGCSMGGVGATGFTHMHPEICLAESSFAGRDFCLYLHRNDPDSDVHYDETNQLRVARAFGYADMEELLDDGFSKCIGYYPSTGLIKISNNGFDLPPDRKTNYLAWQKYYGDLETFGKNDELPTCIGVRKIPYKAWNSWNDRVGDTKFEELLA